jgi:hypothetical protein
MAILIPFSALAIFLGLTLLVLETLALMTLVRLLALTLVQLRVRQALALISLAV